MEFDHSKLLGRIKEKIGSQAALADRLGWSASKLSDKLNNKRPFTDEDVYLLSSADCLDIDPEDTVAYFFTPKFDF